MLPFRQTLLKIFPILSLFLWLVVGIILLPESGAEMFNPWSEQRISEMGYKYSQSQYVVGEAGEKISDSDLYEYAGRAYVQGDDPTTINFEHPPLGKYFLGLSWMLFGNPYTLNIAFFLVSLGSIWVLGKNFALSSWILFIGQGLFTLTVGSIGLASGLLDIQLIAWTGLFFSLLFWQREIWHKYTLIGVVLGAIVATKYPIPNILPYAFVLFLWSVYNRKLPYLFLSGVSAGVVYLASYAMFFQDGKTLLDLLAFEKYRFRWWTGERPTRAALIWQLLFLGKFEAWWQPGEWHSDQSWNISLPTFFVASSAALLLSVKEVWKKRKLSNEFLQIFALGIFSLSFMALYTVGSANAARYLFVLYPLWFVLAAYGMSKITQTKMFKRN